MRPLRPEHQVLLAKAHVLQDVHEADVEVEHRDIVEILAALHQEKDDEKELTDTWAMGGEKKEKTWKMMKN